MAVIKAVSSKAGIGDIDEAVETQLESFIAYDRDGSVYCRSEEMKTSPSFQKIIDIFTS